PPQPRSPVRALPRRQAPQSRYHESECFDWNDAYKPDTKYSDDYRKRDQGRSHSDERTAPVDRHPDDQHDGKRFYKFHRRGEKGGGEYRPELNHLLSSA